LLLLLLLLLCVQSPTACDCCGHARM